jgi:hypothetical protein
VRWQSLFDVVQPANTLIQRFAGISYRPPLEIPGGGVLFVLRNAASSPGASLGRRVGAPTDSLTCGVVSKDVCSSSQSARPRLSWGTSPPHIGVYRACA